MVLLSVFMKHTEEQVSLEGQNVTNSFIPLSGSPGSLTCTPNQNLAVQLKHMWEIEESLCYFIIKEYSLYWIHLLVLTGFFVESFRLSIYKIMSSSNREIEGKHLIFHHWIQHSLCLMHLEHCAVAVGKEFQLNGGAALSGYVSSQDPDRRSKTIHKLPPAPQWCF